jgi:hypothetical protein
MSGRGGFRKAAKAPAWLAARAGVQQPGTNKYRAQRTKAIDGREFAGKAEAMRYEQLRILERAGQIRDLRCQVIYHFPINGELLTVNGRKARYTADFVFVETATGETVVEDSKGKMTNDALLRIGLMKAVHGINVRLTGAREARKNRAVPRGKAPPKV